MKSILNFRFYLYIILLLMLSACQSDTLIDDSQQSIIVRLSCESLNQTRNNTNLFSDNVDVQYLLSDLEGNIISGYSSSFNTSQSSIVIEPLPRGSYQLYVLAYSKSLNDRGFTINKDIYSINQTWFTFENETPLVSYDEYVCYGQLAIDVTTSGTLDFALALKHALSAVDIHSESSNQYLNNIITAYELNATNPTAFYNGMNVNGGYTGESTWSEQSISIKENAFVMMMPAITSDAVGFSLSLSSVNHKKFEYQSNYYFSTHLLPGTLNTIDVSLNNHPDAKVGTYYISKAHLNQYPQPLLLQDDEPKELYYDRSERSFFVNQPLQIKKLDQAKINIRFYAPLPLSDVSIWATIPSINQEILIAYCDSIPAFSNMEFDIPAYSYNREYDTSLARRISLTDEQTSLIGDEETTIRIECNDLLWQQISIFKPKWEIAFNSFGGNPELDNGGPAGNWMGIRPVHIRESICFFLNFAYMISTQEFVDHLMTFQGQIVNNNGAELDLSIVPDQFIAHGGFNVGLVYAGNGVLGLGGGRTWGVYQQAYMQHYYNTYSANIMFHELGHCIGYSHSSGMSYGPWAEQCANYYYVNNLSSFPVYSIDILNSRYSSYLY